MAIIILIIVLKLLYELRDFWKIISQPHVTLYFSDDFKNRN